MLQRQRPAPGLGLGLVLAARDGAINYDTGLDLDVGPLVVRLKAHARGPKRRHDERVELTVCLENSSGKPLFLRLGTLAGVASDAAVLAAAGLQTEHFGEDGESRWCTTKVLEPRAVPGGLPVISRNRALYLPPWQGAQIPLSGIALGSAISFGGSSGDDSETLLPLPEVPEEPGGAIRCRLRFALNIDGANADGLPRGASSSQPAYAWVGPFVPPRPSPDEDLCWQGQATSQTLKLAVCPIIAPSGACADPVSAASVVPTVRSSKPSPMPRAPRWPKPGKTHRRKLRAAAVTHKKQLCLGSLAITDDAPIRPSTKELHTAAASTVGSLVGGAIEDVAATRARKGSKGSAQLGSRGSARSGLDSAISSAQAAQDLDFVPSSASSSSAATGLGATTKVADHTHPAPPSQPASLALIKASEASSTRCRGNLPSLRTRDKVCRNMICDIALRRIDPLSDPVLLELAEIIDAMKCQSSTITLCTNRLKARTGQRFVSALRARGHRVLPAPDVRVLSTWVLAPRAFQYAEELVLVADWQELANCFSVIQQASQSGATDFHVSGAVALCERGEEMQATAAVAEANLPCHCRVLSSLAF